MMHSGEWAVFNDTESNVGHIAGQQWTSDFEACKRSCEQFSLSGFVHYRGMVYFRKAKPGVLFKNRRPCRGATLFVRQELGALPLAASVALPLATSVAVSPPTPVQRGRSVPQQRLGKPQEPRATARSASPGSRATAGAASVPMGGAAPHSFERARSASPGKPAAAAAEGGGGQLSHLVMPPREVVERLAALSEAKLERMLQSPEALQDWIAGQSEVQAQEERIEKIRQEETELEEQIRAREASCEEARAGLEAGHEAVAAQQAAVQELGAKRDKILARSSPGEMAVLLEQLAEEAECRGEDLFLAVVDAPMGEELDAAGLQALRQGYVGEKTTKHAWSVLAKRQLRLVEA